MCLVSVVIPVYNVAPFLRKSVESVLGQSLQDIEIICVDDHSTDNSLEILESIVDPRLRIIRFPENRGVAAARSAGLDSAKGKYVYSLDSDDWIDQEYIEAMYTKAIETGQNVVINANWYIENEESNEKKRSGDFGFIHKGAGYYPTNLVQMRFFPVFWTRLYRLDYLRLNNIRPPLIGGGVDDNFFTGLAEILQEKSYIFHGPFYHYRRREGSLVTRPDTGFLHFECFRLFYDELENRCLPKGSARLFYCHPKLIISNQDQFDFIRRFFLDVKDEVRAFLSYYSELDIFLMNSVLECEDYKTWSAKYKPSVLMSFVSSKNKR